MLALNALAAGAGLVGPWLLGRIIDEVRAGGGVASVDRLALVILVFALAQLVLARYARLLGHRFGERTLARLREEFVDRALALPASMVERAGTGDLMARGTADVAAVGTTLRDAGPEVFIAAVAGVFILGAVLVLDPLLGACGVLGLLGIWFAARWYLRRARNAYLAEGAANSALAEQLAATAAGARTVEAFGLQRRRIGGGERAIDESRRTRIRTLFLRSVLFPPWTSRTSVPWPVSCWSAACCTPTACEPRRGGRRGAVPAAAAEPLDTILIWIEQLQSSSASFARVEGLGRGARTAARRLPARTPADDRIEVTGVRYAYDGGGRDATSCTAST